MQHTKVYSMTGTFLGVLENAKAGYTLKDVPVSTAKIELPLDDEGNELCAPFNRVEVFDGNECVDMFRFIATTKGTIRATGGSITYKAEHVIATLMDNLMPGYHEIGGTGMSLTDCINYILGFQSAPLWRLGRCDFTTYFQYSFSSAYLLNALLALPKQLAEGYLWTTDTTTTPWTLNLVRPPSVVGCEILYKHNMTEIAKSSDEGTLCTRCYPYGYGEGMNQLTIRDANNGRLYIDADTITIWGVKEKPFVDTTFERPDALKRRAEQWLEGCKNPSMTYTAKAIDLSRLTGEPMDTFRPGKLCRINDQEHGVLVEARITQISKDDPTAKPWDIIVTLSSSAASIANEIADLASRVSVNELTAQGATNIAPIYFWNNADKDHPIEIPYDIVAEYVRINKLRLIMHIGSFRSYSLGAAAGGGTLTSTYDGGGGTRTSGGGGADTITEGQKIVTTEAVTGGTISGHSDDTSGNTGGALDYGGALMNTTDQGGGGIGGTPVDDSGAAVTYTATNPSYDTGSGGGGIGGTPVDAGGDAVIYTATNPTYGTGSDGGGSTGSGGGGIGGTPVDSSGGAITYTATNSSYDTGGATGSTASATASHRHAIGSHMHQQTTGTYTGATTPSCGESDNTSHSHGLNSHTHSIGGHSHTFSHRHEGAAHTHGIGTHTHSIGGHSHAFSHRHAGAAHNHSIGGHSHTFSHRHAGAAHTHGMSHVHNFSHMHNAVVVVRVPSFSITIKSHTHAVEVLAHSHNLTLENHTHEDVPGIYDGDSVSKVAVEVDGTVVPDSAIVYGEANLIPYLSKDASGKVVRGQHMIRLIPVPTEYNPKGLCSIGALLSVVVFVRSQGGGDY